MHFAKVPKALDLQLVEYKTICNIIHKFLIRFTYNKINRVSINDHILMLMVLSQDNMSSNILNGTLFFEEIYRPL